MYAIVFAFVYEFGCTVLTLQLKCEIFVKVQKNTLPLSRGGFIYNASFPTRDINEVSPYQSPDNYQPKWC
jgi:hypothetical protein